MVDVPEKVKDLFKMDGIRKNIRIHFPNGERADIINSQITEESFDLTESLCSQDTIKFGLCETSVVQFECMGIENLKGYEIEVYHEIDISILGEEFIAEYGMRSNDVDYPFYRFLYGTFIVDESKRQADMKRRNVVAYFKTNNNNWDFNEVTKGVLQNNLWKYPDVNLDFSVEGIVDLLIPENAIYSLGKKDEENYTNTYSIGKDSLGNGYALYVTYNQWSRLRHENGWIVECIKEEYTDEYIQKVKQLKDEIDKLRITVYYSSGREPIYLNKVKTSNLCYRNYEFAYSDLIESIDVMYDEDNRVYFFSDVLNPQRNTISYPRIWQEYDFPESNKNEYWRNLISADVFIPTQIQLKNITTDELIFDTGIYDNKAYFNNESPIFLQESVSGYFLTLAIPYEKTITMEKYTERTDTYTEVKQTVYAYEPQPIDDLKHVIESYLELNCSFGRYGRDGSFSQVKLNSNLGLYPSEDLYPSDDLFPIGPSGGTLARSNYISAWYDDAPTKAYDRVSATYINTEGKETYTYYQIIDPKSKGYRPENYQTYSLTDNFFIQNSRFTKEQILSILEYVGEHIKELQYMPADIELVGLPYIEVGDVVQIITNDSGIVSIILRRTMSGIQSLKDNFESK